MVNDLIFFFIHLKRVPSGSNNGGSELFAKFLEKISGDNQYIDNLRLPLQVALLISPILLLQEVQFHTSTFYIQRYKLALVGVVKL